MRSIAKTAADRRTNPPTIFRCNQCRVAFTPTRHEVAFCPRCAAGRQLYRTIREYQAVRP